MIKRPNFLQYLLYEKFEDTKGVIRTRIRRTDMKRQSMVTKKYTTQNTKDSTLLKLGDPLLNCVLKNSVHSPISQY